MVIMHVKQAGHCKRAVQIYALFRRELISDLSYRKHLPIFKGNTIDYANLRV